MKIKYQAEGFETFISIELDEDTSADENVSAVARLMRAIGFHENSVVNAMRRYADENTPASHGDIKFDFEED